MVLDRIKKALTNPMKRDDFEDEYIEIDLGKEEKDNKVLVKLFVLKNYEDSNEVLNSIRDGYTIAVIDIRELRKRDSIELKRAISKIKKTADALEGSIAGFGENIVIVTPAFAKIYKETAIEKKEVKDKLDYY